MGRRIGNGHCRGGPLLAIVLALAIAGAMALLAAPAFALPTYVHDGASACSSCHGDAAGTTPATSTNCQKAGCHANFALHPTDQCWSCHAPGQDMTSAMTNAGCTTTCHVLTANTNTSYTTNFTHTGHLGSNLEPCRTCHAVSTSPTNAGSSVHHNGEILPEVPTCTTCHATPPVDKAPAPHPQFVAAVTACATCHVGMSPHPAASNIAKPTLTIKASGPTAGNTTLSGSLKRGATALAGVGVYLQVKTPGSASYADLPAIPVTTATDGSFSYTVTSATAGAFYRAVSQGVAGPPVVSPAVVSTEPVKATLTLKLTSTSIKLHKSITAKGVLGPAGLRGLSVKLTAQRKVGSKWVKAAPPKTKATAAATGAFSWKYTPTKRGSYRMFATIAKTTQHTAAKSPVRFFKVK